MEKKQLGLSKRAVSMRADFAWPAVCVAVEIQGGAWVRSGHSSGTGIDRDAAKSLIAQCDGWVLASLTGNMVLRQADIWFPKLANTIRSRKLLMAA